MPCICGSNFIENKKYNLCQNCNFKRNHNGKSQNEVYSERKKEREKTIQVPYKYRTSIPTERKPVVLTKKAKEERNIKSKLSVLKKEIRQEAIDNDTYFCKGCLSSSQNLDCSHILPVGRFKEFELIKEIIQLLCRKCHLTWESAEIQKMIKLHCFSENLEIIKKYSGSEYNKLIIKLNERLK